MFLALLFFQAAKEFWRKLSTYIIMDSKTISLSSKYYLLLFFYFLTFSLSEFFLFSKSYISTLIPSVALDGLLWPS